VTGALLAGVAAAIVATLAGFPFVSYLRERRIGKAISADGPESHFVKAGTPTMGGLLIIGVGLLVALVAALPRDTDVLLPIAVAAVMTVIGFYDDLGTLIDRAQRAAHDRTGMILKLGAFAVVGIVVAYVLYDVVDAPRLLVPNAGSYDIGPIYLLIALAVFIAATASVGVTDGLDMLAGSTNAAAFGAYGVLALMQDQDALATFCFAVTGALLGFLWHNAYPARIFMGDSGSLPLGAALGVVALQTGWWLLLPLIGIVFVIDMLSDVIQIGYFRITGGKRVFRMAPIHHHFEKLGWPETWVTVRFLLIGITGALLALSLAAWD
jgi:phospho-N-acetylmuramoyl-pentapeptide-transferase